MKKQKKQEFCPSNQPNNYIGKGFPSPFVDHKIASQLSAVKLQVIVGNCAGRTLLFFPSFLLPPMLALCKYNPQKSSPSLWRSLGGRKLKKAIILLLQQQQQSPAGRGGVQENT